MTLLQKGGTDNGVQACLEFHREKDPEEPRASLTGGRPRGEQRVQGTRLCRLWSWNFQLGNYVISFIFLGRTVIKVQNSGPACSSASPPLTLDPDDSPASPPSAQAASDHSRNSREFAAPSRQQ